MSSRLYRLGRACATHAWRVVVAWVVLLLALGIAALVTGGKLKDSFSIPNSEGMMGMNQLSNRFPELAGMTADVLIEAPEGTQLADFADDVNAIVAAAGDVTAVSYVRNPLDEIAPAISDNGRFGLATVQISASMGQVPPETRTGLEALHEVLPADSPLTIYTGGRIYDMTSVHISVTEVLGVVVALITLAVSFHSIVAAGLPILTALVGVGIGMMLTLIAAAFMDIITTTPTLALMIGLAVGIDYSLFILHRHRSELAALNHKPSREEVIESVGRANATAGSSVVFAGATVMIALCGLVVAGLPFLSIMGFAAAGTVGVAVMVALTLVPAIAGLMGARLQPRGRGLKLERNPGRTMGSRWVGLVTKFPVVFVILVIAGLGSLLIPARDLHLTLPDNGTAELGSTQRTTYDLIAQEFGPGANSPLVMTFDIAKSTDPLGLMQAIGDDIATDPGVDHIVIATPNRTADLGVIVIQPTTDQSNPATTELVQRLRDRQDEIADTYDVQNVYVTGQSAVGMDVTQKLGDSMVPFGLVVVGLSLVLLMLVFRSIWVPVTAALGYLLSVVGAFGLTVVVFEYGFGADLLGVQKIGPVISFLPIILMGVLFGLAMDYQVFLVSRMREDYVHTGNAQRSIRTGFAASARVVTTAAIIMFSVFAFFVPAADWIVKAIAFSLAVGVAIDAFIVRMTLIPALMAILGDHAWWLPRWLDRRLPYLDIEGEGLAHHIAHRQWVAKNGAAVIRAEDVTIHVDGRDVIQDFSLVVRPGERVEIITDDDIAARALLAALSGRLSGDSETLAGTLVVLGYLVPPEAGSVRRATALVLDDTTPLPVEDAPAVVLVHGPVMGRTARAVEELVKGGTAVVIAVARENAPREALLGGPAQADAPTEPLPVGATTVEAS